MHFTAQAKKYNMPYLFPIRCPCANDIMYAKFEDVRIFLYAFISVAKLFECQKLSVNVPVAISFTTQDRVFLRIYIALPCYRFVSSHVYWLIFTFFARTLVLAKRQSELACD